MAAYTQDCDETVTVTDSLLLARPYAYVTNSVRTSASTLLRLRRKPVRYVSFELPPHYGYLEPGDTIWSAHDLVPEAATGADRYDLWRLIPLEVVEVYDPLAPAKISIKCVDLRDAYCSWWSPLQTDIGMTDDLNGIAVIDRAGGWETLRDQVGYGVRPPGNDAFQEVLANNPIVDAYGLLCQGGGDVNHLLNSTFSEGAGDVFTSWTKTLTGAAVGVGWTLYTLIDATGFRRAIQLATYATSEQAYVSQTVNALENKTLAVKVYYKDGGAVDRMGLRISRSDTGEYLDSAGAWQGSTQTIVLTPGSGVIETERYVSPNFDTTAGGAVNITVAVGHFSAVFNAAQISQIQAVELIEVPADGDGFARMRGPLPTKAAAVTRVANVTRIVNDSAVRVLSPTRGFFKLTYVPLFDHADMIDGRYKYILCSDFNEGTNTQWLRLYYSRQVSTDGIWRLAIGVSDYAELAVAGTDLLTANTEYVIIGRWTSEAIDEHNQPGQTLDLWVNGVKGTPLTGQTERGASVDCNVYLGSSLNITDNEYADGHLRFITIDIRCPDEAELLRI